MALITGMLVAANWIVALLFAVAMVVPRTYTPPTPADERFAKYVYYAIVLMLMGNATVLALR